MEHCILTVVIRRVFSVRIKLIRGIYAHQPQQLQFSKFSFAHSPGARSDLRGLLSTVIIVFLSNCYFFYILEK